MVERFVEFARETGGVCRGKIRHVVMPLDTRRPLSSVIRPSGLQISGVKILPEALENSLMSSCTRRCISRTYIHGEIAKGRPIKFEDLMAHMKADHTSVEDVGRIAQQAGAKSLVLSHLIPAFDNIGRRNLARPGGEAF